MGIDVDPIGERLVLQSVTVSLGSAQLLALNTTPVTIVPAPGVGKYTLVLGVSYELIYGSAAYGNIDSPGLFYGSFNGSASYGIENSSAAAVFGQSGNAVGRGRVQGGVVSLRSVVENTAVVFADDAGWTTGNGTGSITVFYVTLTL
jgi:hypothetical protein